MGKNHISLMSAQSMFEICSSLFKYFPVQSVTYVRSYPDGTRTPLLSNSDSLIKHIEFEKQYLKKFPTPYASLPIGTSCMSLNEHILTCQAEEVIYLPIYKSLIEDEARLFNMGNIFGISIKSDTYCDTLNFLADINNTAINDMYFANQDLLIQFCYYFLDKANDIILQVEPFKYQTSHPFKENGISNNRIPDEELFTKAIQPKRYHLAHPSPVYLTGSEMRCARLIVQHMTNKEVAYQLNVSTRTVEQHIDNIKLKLGVYSKKQIIHALSQLKMV